MFCHLERGTIYRAETFKVALTEALDVVDRADDEGKALPVLMEVRAEEATQFRELVALAQAKRQVVAEFHGARNRDGWCRRPLNEVGKS